MVNMVNTMDLSRGFLKLQEDNNSRRSSSLFRQKPLELNENGLHYVTRINCGCGQCVPFRVKVERDDGGLRIGKLTLATNCHLIIIIFGFFFLIAGSVLTALAYKKPAHDPDLPQHERASPEHLDSPSRQEGKVAGPIFIIVGSALVLMGFTLTALACKMNREAKRQLHLSRFTWETPPIQTPDIFNNSTTPSHHGEHFATFANNLDTFSVRSRELSTCSANSGGGVGGGRRDSSFTFTRQQQHPPPPLSTIAQAVPVGIFLFGGGSGPDSATSPRSPTIRLTDPSGFQEIELGSPTTESAPASASAFSRGHIMPPDAYKKHRSQSDGSSPDDMPRTYQPNRNLNPNDPTGQSKVNLALRPSLPIIPMFATSSSPHYFSRVVTPLDARNLYVSSRSDEPFGSIASLSTSKDIACFPDKITQPAATTLNPSGKTGNNKAATGNHAMHTAPEGDDGGKSTTSPSHPTKQGISNQSSLGANTVNNNDDRKSQNQFTEQHNNQKNDANLNSGKRASEHATHDVIGRPSQDIPRNTSGISELPPINVNDYGSKLNSGKKGVGGGGDPGAAFRPKSILRKSKSEDSQDDGNTGGEEREILQKK